MKNAFNQIIAAVLFIVAIIAFISCNPETEYSQIVEANEASRITCISAVLSASIHNYDGSNNDVEYGIMYSTSPDFILSSAITIKAEHIDSKGFFTIVLNYLKPSTSYFWKTYMQSDSNVSMGDIQTFATKSKDETITTKNAEGINNKEATIYGSIDLTDLQFSFIRSGFLFGLSKNALNDFLDCQIEDGIIDRKMDDLVQGTEYYYCSALYVDDYCLCGDTLSFTTASIPDFVHSEPVTDIQCLHARLNAIVDTAGIKFSSIQYGFLFGEDVNNLGKQYASLVGNKLSFSVSGLKPSTTYYCQPYAVLDETDQHFGSLLPFTTKEPWVFDTPVDLKQTATGMQIYVPIIENGYDVTLVVLKHSDENDNGQEWKPFDRIPLYGATVYLDLPVGCVKYGVYLEDMLKNTSEIYTIDISILYKEEQLDKSLFSDANIADDNCKALNNNYPVYALWDGSGQSASPHFFTSETTSPSPCWLTIDLGATACLNRIATLPRIAYIIYGGAAVRDYEFWGSPGEDQPDGTKGKPSGKVLAPTADNPYGFDTNVWFPLGRFTQSKPSGYLSNGLPGTITAEDAQAYNAGNNFVLDSKQFPHCNDPIRYLRVVFVNTFNTFEFGHDSSYRMVQAGEITPWTFIEK